MDDQERPSYYAVIPADVRYDDQLTPNAKLMYGEISALIGDKGYCFASNQYFAEPYGWTDVTVSRLISSLVKAGYIIRELEKDASGQVVRRKMYLRVSVPHEQPLNNFDNTPLQDCGEGLNKNVKDTNLSLPCIEKENKKEKAKGDSRVRLTDAQLLDLCVEWISSVAADDWTRQGKNDLYLALSGFYEPRDSKKKEPSRTKAAFTALTNRLARYSKGIPTVMIDMLERATTAGWKSVYPLEGDNGVASAAAAEGDDGDWL